MRLLWIQAKNFKCYSDIRVPAQGVLPEGLLFVEGENSTGKSSLFDAIFYALFYEPTTTKELGTKDDLVRRGFSDTEVEVAFELDNKCYLIQRSHGKKTPVQAFLLEIDRETALQGKISKSKKICDGVIDVENKITSFLNINKEKILNTLVVRQGSVQALAEAKGAELRNIIYELFQLDFYRDRAIDIIKNKKNNFELQKEKYTIKRTTEDILNEINEIKDSIDEAKTNIAEYDSSLEKLKSAIKQFPEFKEMQEINGLTQRLNQQNDTIEKKEKSITEASKKYSLVPTLGVKNIELKSKEIERQIQDKFKEKENKSKEIEKINKEKANNEIDLENFTNRKVSLERIAETGEKPKCDVCEQEIDEPKFNELLERSKSNIPALTKGIKKKEEEIRNLKSEIQDIEQNITQLKIDIGKLEDLTNDLEELEEMNNVREEMEQKIQNSLQKFKVQSLLELSEEFGLKDFNELFEHVKSLDDDIKSNELKKKHTLGLIEEKYDTIEKRKNQIEENKKKEEKAAEIDLEIALLTEVQTYVEKFIAEDIISNRMLANIQQSTKGYIYLFTRGRYSELYLEPTRTKTLNMSIKDEELGFVKSQTLLSGGDKAAIGLGLRIGVSELLKRIRPMKTSPYEPPKMDILVLDEPLGSLDEARRAKVIEGLVSEEKFSQIFLITHTNIRRRFRAPLITIQSSSTGSKAIFYPSTSEIEEEAEP